ncbi:MAG: protein adenylyltransferase SelO family protein [Chitinophagales bacterium]|nr:protein adenylyltransferase SelO family protein [Chitinophagales bacterium]
MNTAQFNNNFTDSFSTNTSFDNRPRFLSEVNALVNPEDFPNSKLLYFNNTLAHTLGISQYTKTPEDQLALLIGKNKMISTKPYATNYCGHQFGSWAGQLGDGRAICIADLTVADEIYSIQLKGSGLTPFSRRGDGRAVLRSTIREALIQEYFHALNIPTTRTLALGLTGEKVTRDMFYDGNLKLESGAILARVSPSFIRFGHFECLASKKDFVQLKKLWDYIKINFYHNQYSSAIPSDEMFFEALCTKTLELIDQWMNLGWVHGVLNSDNMSMLGLSIDFGPFGFMGAYDPKFTPNWTDSAQGLYRFENQYIIAFKNLLYLANAIVPIFGAPKPIEDILYNAFENQLNHRYEQIVWRKLGLANDSFDVTLTHKILSMMAEFQLDFTLFFRYISCIVCQKKEYALEDISNLTHVALTDEQLQSIDNTMKFYLTQLNLIDKTKAMTQVIQYNPEFIPDNEWLFTIIQEVEHKNFNSLDEAFHIVSHPRQALEINKNFFSKKKSKLPNPLGIHVLSCSS